MIDKFKIGMQLNEIYFCVKRAFIIIVQLGQV